MAGDAHSTRPPAAREHDQEHDMTSPTQRRHDEILGRLDALIDAVTPPTYTIETRTCRKAERVTEEPPVGSQVTCGHLIVWHRLDVGWRPWVTERGEWDPSIRYQWFLLRQCTPLRFTTDADRERVGLPVDTAPDVDPDEAQEDVERLTRERDAAVARAERAELSVDRSLTTTERVIRERDEWREVAKVAGSRANSEATHRAAADARYEALRGAIKTDPGILRLAATDIEAAGTGWGGLPRSLPVTLRGLADILTSDDERGRDE